MKKTVIRGYQMLLAMSCVAFSSSGCSNTATPGNSSSRQLGEECNETYGCDEGLYCEDQICRQVCKSNNDCAQDQYCNYGKCVKKLANQCQKDEECINPPSCKKGPGHCVNKFCEYNDLECNTPPKNYCNESNDKYITFAATGTCNVLTGQCDYTNEETECADCLKTCSSCKDVECPEVSADGCKINGTCDPDTLDCIYDNAPNLVTACLINSNTQGICNDGVCYDCIKNLDNPKHCDQPPKNNGCYTAACEVSNTCNYTVTPGVVCSAQRCENGILYQESKCTELGDCNTESRPCEGNLRCKDENDCLNSCDDDNDCIEGAYCYNGTCLLYLEDGDDCVNPDDAEWCKNGSCCISKLCSSKTGKCGDSCVDVGCANGLNCDRDSVGGPETGRCCASNNCCDENADCAENYLCDATGNCKGNDGAVCEDDRDCENGNCVEGICCDTACSDSCSVCNSPEAMGKCTPVNDNTTTKCHDNIGCPGNNCSCNNNAKCVGQLGDSCGEDTDCASGFCADNVCCDTECDTKECQTCGEKSSAGLGHCGYVTDNSDPRNDCAGITGSITCKNLCQYSGKRNTCSGTGYSCKDIDSGSVNNIESGKICVNNNIISPNATSNCGSDKVTVSGACSGTQYFLSCNGSGSCRTGSDHLGATSQTIYAAKGQTYSDSKGNQSAGVYCREVKCTDTYTQYVSNTCNGSGTCNAETKSCLSQQECLDGTCQDYCSSEDTCDDGYHCINSIHACRDGAIGTICDEKADCDNKLQCDSSTHKCRLSKNGESCDTAADCLATGGYYCIATSSLLTRKFCYNGQEGDYCQITQSGQCKSGLGCYLVKEGTLKPRMPAQYQCLTGKSGSPCVDDSSCATGYKCRTSSKTCINGTLNSPCDTDEDCDDNLTCTSSKLCKKINRQACSNNSECASSRCTVSAISIARGDINNYECCSSQTYSCD